MIWRRMGAHSNVDRAGLRSVCRPWLAVAAAWTLPLLHAQANANTPLPPPPLVPLSTEAVALTYDAALTRASATIAFRRSDESHSLELPSRPDAVLRNHAVDAGLSAEFTVVSDIEGSLLLATISVPVSALPDSRAGTYQLVFTALNSAGITHPLPSPLVVPVTLLASTLHPPGTVVIDRRDMLVLEPPDLPSLELGDTSTGLRLALKSGPSITGLKISQLGAAKDADGRPLPGADLEIEDLAGPITLTEPQIVGIQTSGSFPLGKSTGQLLVRAPGMMEVVVPFEVTVRRSMWVIAFVSTLGLMVGSWIRRGIEGRIERLTLLNVFDRFAQRLQVAQRQRREQTFSDEVKRILETIKDSRQALRSESRTVDIVKGELDEQRKALDAAIEEFANRQKDLKKQIDEAIETLAKTWSLPAAVGSALEHALTRLRAVAIDIQAGRLDEARTARTNAIGEFIKSAGAASAAWVQGLVTPIDGLEASGEAVPAAAKDALTEHADILRENFDTLNAAASPDIERAGAMIEALDKASGAAFQWLTGLLRHVRDSLDDVARMLASDGHSDAAKRIRDVLLPLAGIDVNNAVDNGQFAAPVLAVTRALEVTRQSLTASASKPEALDDWLNKGHYRRAAQLVVHTPQPQTTARRGLKGVKADFVSLDASPRRRTFSAERVTLPTPWEDFDDDTIVLRGRKIVWLRRSQTALVWAALVAVAMWLFGPTFVGHGRELAMIFFWGLSTDIAANSVFTQITARVLPK